MAHVGTFFDQPGSAITAGEQTWLTNGLAGQVAFPATQNPSTGANVLDDYEEGTWTPVLTFPTPGDLSVVYAAGNQQGTYTKIGRDVFIDFNIRTTTFTHTTASGNAQVTGLPFTSANVAERTWGGPLVWAGITKATYTAIVVTVAENSAIASLQASGSAVATDPVAVANMPTTGNVVLRGAMTYQV